MLDRAVRCIRRLERRYYIDFGVLYVQIGRSKEASFVAWNLRPTIFLGEDLRGRAFLEFLYHELGHVLASQYDLTLFKRRFSKRAARSGYERATEVFRRRPRSYGFPSGYAEIDWEEDFAETFSCYMVNKGKTRGAVYYGGEHISLSGDLRLRRKLTLIRAILRYCRDSERQRLEEAS